MAKRKKKAVEWQELSEIDSHFDASHTEQSQYWQDFAKRREKAEHPQANPDVLPEGDEAEPSTPQLIMGEAVDHLQGRQKEVYLLTMREGRSLAEAAELLGISKPTAQKYRDRAIKFIKAYCDQAMQKGRI